LLACAAVGIAGLQGMRGWRRPVRWLVVSQEAVLDDVPLERVRLRWRGSLAFFQARDATGRTHRLAWWPDTLDATGRRALRLAIDGLQHPAR
jgi:toxin CptA